MTPSKKHRWESAGSIYSAALCVPPRSGVYAIGLVKHVGGLPIAAEWMYVGRTSKLRQRLSQHEPETERKPDLAIWLQLHRGHAQVWFTPVSVADSVELEAQLIRELRPVFNKRVPKAAGLPATSETP